MLCEREKTNLGRAGVGRGANLGRNEGAGLRQPSGLLLGFLCLFHMVLSVDVHVYGALHLVQEIGAGFYLVFTKSIRTNSPGATNRCRFLPSLH